MKLPDINSIPSIAWNCRLQTMSPSQLMVRQAKAMVLMPSGACHQLYWNEELEVGIQANPLVKFPNQSYTVFTSRSPDYQILFLNPVGYPDSSMISSILPSMLPREVKSTAIGMHTVYMAMLTSTFQLRVCDRRELVHRQTKCLLSNS